MMEVRAADDRERSVTCFQTGPLFGRPDTSLIPRAEMRTILRELLWPRMVLVLPLYMGALLGLSAVGALVRGRMPDLAVAIAAIGTTAVMGLLGFLGLVRAPVASWRLIAVLLRHGRCAQCAYPLGDSRIEADGCRVCPECGAAWNAILPARRRSPGEAWRWGRDHRGRRGQVLLASRDAARRRVDKTWWEVERAVRAGMGIGPRPLAILAGLTLILAGLLLAASEWKIAGCVIVVVGIAIGCARFETRSSRLERRIRLVRLWLAQRRCAHCGFSLAGVEEAGDGCRVCPACGAAWHVPPGVERDGEGSRG